MKMSKRFSLAQAQSAGRIHKSTVKPAQMASLEFFLECVLFSEGQKRRSS